MAADVYDFVAGLEGFSPKAYWDHKQWSIGYGTRANGPGETIDQNAARQRLRDEVDKAQSHVDKAFPNLAPHQRSALASFTYNLGPGWMTGPTRMSDAVRSGDWNSASRIMQEYNKASGQFSPGLANRRAKEAALFSGGDVPFPPSSPAAPAPAGPRPMAMTDFYSGDSPEEVDRKRKIASALMAQGTSAAPVGHWTQALARVMQGGMGGFYDQQASAGEKAGRASVTQALMGGGTAAEKMAALSRTPWGQDMASKLAMGGLQEELAADTPTGKLRLQKMQEELDALKEKRSQDKWIFGEAQAAERPQAAGAPAPAIGGGAISGAPASNAPGTTMVDLPAGVAPMGSHPQPQPQAAPDATGEMSPQTLREVLASRTPAERRAFVATYQKDPIKGMAMIREWVEGRKTPDIDNYNFDMKQRAATGQPSIPFAQWKKELKQPLVQFKDEAEYDKERGKALSKSFEETQKAGIDAANRKTQLKQLDALLSNPNVYTGTGATYVQALKRAGKSLLNLDIEGVGAADTAGRLSTEMALALKSNLPGPMSNADREFLVGLPPNITDTAEGRKLLISMMLRTEERKEVVAKLQREYRAKNGRLDDGWFDELAQFNESNPVFTPEIVAQAQAAASTAQQPPPWAGLPKEVTLPDGRKIRARKRPDGQWETIE